ncbi:hypothetical protein BH10PSE13_BH10PSE13_20390 [soil metagenome]
MPVFSDGLGDNMRWTSAFFIVPVFMAANLAAAAGPGVPPAALATLEPGQWELRSRDAGEPAQRLCVRDLMTLIQLRHQGQVCRRYVVEDGRDRTSIAYDCPGTGHGRTEVRVETSRLAQIDTQGVVDGYPFAMTLEARRVGSCTPLAYRK